MSDLGQQHPKVLAATLSDDCELGRDAYGRKAWEDAYTSLTRADETVPLAVADLERLAWSAGLTGRDKDFLRVLERIYHGHLEANASQRAARSAFWLGLRLLSLGEVSRATGWLGRAERLIADQDWVERGYLLIPVIHRHLAAGDYEIACGTAANAIEIGERFGEADLIAFARCLLGRVLLRQQRIAAGLASLDDAMLAATTGELSPLIAGLIYCSAIDSCHEVFALGRCREWTSALAAWCAAQPQLVTFTGSCLVHRAEIMQLNGAWTDAIEEARRASTRFSSAIDPEAVAAAFYQQAEIHRLRGEFNAAENDYRSSTQFGGEPQPGLALLRMAQGRGDAALNTIRRSVGATTKQLTRVRLLPAYIEIALAADKVEEARVACMELEKIAESLDSDIVSAIADHARGALRLAEGDARGALEPLRRAFTVWHQTGAPYLAARLRVLVGLACGTLGDVDGASMEFGAARAVFRELGAVPDLNRVDALTKSERPDRPNGLTRRELQVLRLIAAGTINKTIAARLFISEKTVHRHVSNIFTKIDVSSRSAATAYAYEHKLV